jgi:hypothetical protein
MGNDWTPILVLPNLQLQDSVGCEIAAVAPAHDARVAAVKRYQPMFRRFLNRFSDNFGQKFEPAVLILHSDAPPAFREISALASLRDLIAISVVPYNRALQLLQPHSHHRVLFGDAFAIYPWMLDKDYKYAVGSTPAILGIHDVAKFKGQSSPALFRTPLHTKDFDRPLLAALIQCWLRRYQANPPAWRDVALFRSLNMAYHASLLAAGTDANFFDAGRMIALWVSAFEILVHPGGDGQANRDKVFKLIETTAWQLQASGALKHVTGDKAKVKRTAASWLYPALHDRRNAFLHGNPVERTDLLLSETQQPLLNYAAPVYRLALTAFLPLHYEEQTPPISDVQAIAALVDAHTEFVGAQRRIEEAVLAATTPPQRPPGRRARKCLRATSALGTVPGRYIGRTT